MHVSWSGKRYEIIAVSSPTKEVDENRNRVYGDVTRRVWQISHLSLSRGGPRVPLQREKIIPEPSLRNERQGGDGEKVSL